MNPIRSWYVFSGLSWKGVHFGFPAENASSDDAFVSSLGRFIVVYLEVYVLKFKKNIFNAA